ncbi:MAG: hypothetical protein WA792_17785 [Pseudolabrys sp.]|jgi:hypothetical protein
MAIDTHSIFPAATPAAAVADQDHALVASRREKAVTMVAVTLAVLIVAAIAVLMGMG